MAESHRPENMWLDAEAGPVVRPYAMTRGRTRPTKGDFDLIALIVATRPATEAGVGLGPEHAEIMRLCMRPLSVAELAAHLDLPVGIVRVMLGDLFDRGLIVARDPMPAEEMPDEHIFRAVINGLQAL